MGRVDSDEFVETAARLFAGRGYMGVSVADIIDELGCTPPTLYRQFPSKLALLHAVIDTAIERQACDGGDLDEYIARALKASAAWPELIVTYTASRRWLNPADFVDTAQRDADHLEGWRAAIAAAAPALPPLAITVRRRSIGAIVAASAVIPRAAGGSRLRDAFAIGLRDLVLAPLAGDEGSAWLPTGWYVPPTRRQEILDAAIALIGERGYAEVRMDDVGDAVGISGPSVLQHFTTKQQMLVAAFDRGITELMISARVAVAGADSAESALRRLALGLAEAAADRHDLFATLMRESGGLDEPNLERIARLRRDYGNVWAAVICQIWGQLNPETARVVARAGIDSVLSGLRKPDDPSPPADLAMSTLAFIRSTVDAFEKSRQADAPVDRGIRPGRAGGAPRSRSRSA